MRQGIIFSWWHWFKHLVYYFIYMYWSKKHITKFVTLKIFNLTIIQFQFYSSSISPFNCWKHETKLYLLVMDICINMYVSIYFWTVVNILGFGLPNCHNCWDLCTVLELSIHHHRSHAHTFCTIGVEDVCCRMFLQ